MMLPDHHLLRSVFVVGGLRGGESVGRQMNQPAPVRQVLTVASVAYPTAYSDSLLPLPVQCSVGETETEREGEKEKEGERRREKEREIEREISEGG